MRILPPALRLVDLHVRIPRVYAAMLEHFAAAKRISERIAAAHNASFAPR